MIARAKRQKCQIQSVMITRKKQRPLAIVSVTEGRSNTVFANSPARPLTFTVEMPAPRRQQKGLLGSTYETVTSSENAAVVRSVAVFGAAVAFLASSWAELLLPPYVHDPISTTFLSTQLTLFAANKQGSMMGTADVRRCDDYEREGVIRANCTILQCDV
ncbi:hypothetical protein BJ166DRAFT_503395 [Pestalotiopsis sp. NC0098]|nr:hypothetical protein BJ166DRAFT_503395 [Pestalotiopsis sp. NC0098]